MCLYNFIYDFIYSVIDFNNTIIKNTVYNFYLNIRLSPDCISGGKYIPVIYRSIFLIGIGDKKEVITCIKKEWKSEQKDEKKQKPKKQKWKNILWRSYTKYSTQIVHC